VPEVKHICHARNCEKECRPEKLMCPKHWAMVPPYIQRAVYKHYRPGQCDDMKLSRAWLDAAAAAIAAVSSAENVVPKEQTSMFEALGLTVEPEKKGRMH
jgi:hypothetical protein